MKKLLTTTLAICILAWASSAMAVPITKISIPMVGANFNNNTKDFVISGLSNGLLVSYEDSTWNASSGSIFLNTSGLDSQITNNNKTITYTMNGNSGKLDLLDNNYSPLLLGSLEYLQMTIIDPFEGSFVGSGSFLITGGSLASDFGTNGGLATIGIAFNVPLDFSSSFAAMANTTLYPEPVATPEPSTILLLGSGLLGLVGYNRKRFSKKS